jgi:ribonucleoside-triphosphate reductase
MKPEDIRSMCCRLSLNLTELSKRNGGLFGSGDSTGSLGVVTLNLPRLGYKNKGNKEGFYKDLEYLLNLAKESLEIKRKTIQEKVINTHLIPAYCEYVKTINNHFNTIGIIGMNEMCENFFEDGKNILSKEGKDFSIEVSKFIRNKLIEFQKETGNLYNFEATPAESTCYRLAKIDRKMYPDIKTQGTKKSPYYTNSCHIPVSEVESIQQLFDNQDDLQILFTGGTVIHVFLNMAIDKYKAKHIIKTICEKYRVPYISLSPLNRYCPTHGYINTDTDVCPICGKKLDMYQRITGYLRKIEYFNDGKKSEFKDRKQLKI